MAIPPPSSSSGGSGITTFHPPAPSTSTRGGTAKAAVAEQISQTVQSTFNLLQLMQETSPSQAQLSKLPKNLLAKASTMKNTGQILEQLPQVISTLDAHMENGLQSAPHLQTVSQILANMESSQLSSLSSARVAAEQQESDHHAPESG
ncbi:unnamed protein product [Linum trigynum]|uniref:Tobamovirus multiplication protein 2B n=1 Tax=Linum trigynum TaxID=586398 RepID=A0AAV2FN56_9ROSI